MDKLLKEIIKEDKEYYYGTPLKHIGRILTYNPVYRRGKYIITCRKAGYYSTHKSSLINKALSVFYSRRKNVLGAKLNIELGPAEFGRRLKIYHNNVVINFATIIGDDCELYGSNCIGNKGSFYENQAPCLGNKVSVGVGSTIIGNVKIADGVKVSSMSLVNKDLIKENSLYAGIPAQCIES